MTSKLQHLRRYKHIFNSVSKSSDGISTRRTMSLVITHLLDRHFITQSFILTVCQVETKDALLHAINEEYVEAVEVLLEHEELIHRPGELHVSTVKVLLEREEPVHRPG